MKIIELEEVGSTSEYCKQNDCGEDSIMRHFDDFPAENAFKIMVNGCVAVCRTLEKFGIMPVIRWANDMLVNGKKICGTLIENTFSNGKIVRSIVGIGINVNNGISDEIKEIATSIKEATGKKIDLEEVKTAFLENLEKGFTIEDYKRYINWFGRKVTLKTGEEERVVNALNVTENGRLLVDWCGNMLEISAAEVSLRL